MQLKALVKHGSVGAAENTYCGAEIQRAVREEEEVGAAAQNFVLKNERKGNST